MGTNKRNNKQNKPEETIVETIMEDAVEKEEPVCFFVNTELLNTRIKPDINSDLDPYGPLPNGSELEVVEILDDWLKIVSPTGFCYVMSKYVSKK